ncbi:MAG: hypothetical protein HON90_04325 [Halobacteriovoraceae bacterium]|nr:hypothetical protein [Halobacteriovoraceae bacterium]
MRAVDSLYLSENNGASFDFNYNNTDHAYPKASNNYIFVKTDKDGKDNVFIYERVTGNLNIVSMTSTSGKFLNKYLLKKDSLYSFRVDSDNSLMVFYKDEIFLKKDSFEKSLLLEGNSRLFELDSQNNLYFSYSRENAEGILVFPKSVFSAEKINHPISNELVFPPAFIDLDLPRDLSGNKQRYREVFTNANLGIKKLTPFNGIIGSAKTVVVTSDEVMVVGTNKGVCTSKDQGATFKYHHFSIGDRITRARTNKLAIAPDGKIFLAGSAGIWTSTDQGETFKRGPLRASIAYDVLTHSDGNVYLLAAGNFGFKGGLYVSKDGGISYSNQYVGRGERLSIGPSGKMYIWAGITNPGGYRVSTNADFSTFTEVSSSENTGLGLGSIKHLTETKNGNIFLAQSRNVFYVSQDGGKNFDKNYLEDADGNTLGTILGMESKGNYVYFKSDVSTFRSNLDGSDITEDKDYIVGLKTSKNMSYYIDPVTGSLISKNL